jgi:hypothetical protein
VFAVCSGYCLIVVIGIGHGFEEQSNFSYLSRFGYSLPIFINILSNAIGQSSNNLN